MTARYHKKRPHLGPLAARTSPGSPPVVVGSQFLFLQVAQKLIREPLRELFGPSRGSWILPHSRIFLKTSPPPPGSTLPAPGRWCATPLPRLRSGVNRSGQLGGSTPPAFRGSPAPGAGRGAGRGVRGVRDQRRVPGGRRAVAVRQQHRHAAGGGVGPRWGGGSDLANGRLDKQQLF